MKKTGKLCALLLVFLLALVLPTAVFAAQDGSGKKSAPKEKNATVEVLSEEELAALEDGEDALAEEEEADEVESEIDEVESEDELPPQWVQEKKAAKDLLKAEKREMKLMVKGQEMKLTNPPVIKDGRVLIPLRAMAAITGAEVTYDAATKTVTLAMPNGDTVLVTIGDNNVSVNGTPMYTDVPAQIEDGYTIVPLRFVAETLGIKIAYDAEEGIVEIDDEEADEETADEETAAEETVDEEVATDEEVEQTDELAALETDDEMAADEDVVE